MSRPLLNKFLEKLPASATPRSLKRRGEKGKGKKKKKGGGETEKIVRSAGGLLSFTDAYETFFSPRFGNGGGTGRRRRRGRRKRKGKKGKVRFTDGISQPPGNDTVKRGKSQFENGKKKKKKERGGKKERELPY